MKQLHFYKYQGAGNDFIIVDGRTHSVELLPKEILFLCDRRFGIGADGLMVVGNAPDVDFTMRYYNADGHEGTMCGNGGRCLVAYVAQKRENTHFTFGAIDGIHHAKVIGHEGAESQICLGMKNVDTIQRYGNDGFFLNTGSPHLVFFDTDVAQLDVFDRGAFWRNHPDFAPEGVNVNFAGMDADGTLFVRTFERGVENETLACGTGVTAAAIAAYFRAGNKEGTYEYPVRTLGGTLQVSFRANGMCLDHVLLTGPATFVFEGFIDTMHDD